MSKEARKIIDEADSQMDSWSSRSRKSLPKRAKYSEEIGQLLDSGNAYLHAARSRQRAGEIKEAIEDYEKAAHEYQKKAELYSRNRKLSTNTARKYFSEYKGLQEECERNATRLKKVLDKKWNGLGFEPKSSLWKRIISWTGLEKVAATSAVFGILAGIFFLFEPTFTGNAIGSLSNSSSTGVGIILFAIGLIAAFAYVSRKR